jgi:hypothetical protein
VHGLSGEQRRGVGHRNVQFFDELRAGVGLKGLGSPETSYGQIMGLFRKKTNDSVCPG